MASGFFKFLDSIDGTRTVATQATINNKTGGPSAANNPAHMYPSDLFTPENEPYILFFRRDSVAKDAPVVGRVALYMPPDIKVNYGTQWEEIQMTLSQYFDKGADAAKFVQDIYNAGKDGGGALASKLLNKAHDMAMKGAPERILARVVDYAANTNFGQQFEVIQRKTLNPHTALLFKGVNLRRFQFDFQLLARNKQESDAIRDIIKLFKAAMHPKQEESASRFWLYPDNFEIQLYTPNDQYMFKISTCTLEDMSVNYAGSGGGIPSFFEETAAPVDIRMSLQFKELQVLDRAKVEAGF